MPLDVSSRVLVVPKLFPLTISRGTSGDTKNFFIEVSDGTHTGIGEGAPPTALGPDFADSAAALLEPILAEVNRLDLFQMNELGKQLGVEAVALAALDMALWDLKAKQAGMPLYRMLGLPRPTAPTSVTIGIEPKEIVAERVPHILQLTGAKALKVKLGSPMGRDHDREIWETSREAAKPFKVAMRADANGGWTAEEARQMMAWLRDRDCEYVEQPLPQGSETEIGKIWDGRPLPIYLDESIRVASDVARYASCCDGINLKLMKSGGITEGLQVLATAKAHGLGTMIGCMCETHIGIAGSAAISGICDYIDLDSHLNHAPDPATGTEMVDGVVMPRCVPGHGGEFLG
ncbi:dipeptide epimerase [Kamptonema cortianum]|nr:dipeptide epimerase [Geitlerinema splendidum]MDK3161196.1 dipeptide epimerase [Kamptonema cortianum]